MSQEYEPHNGFEKSATFLLEAAESALASGEPRLAVHLYRAAYERAAAKQPVVSGHIIAGLRKAWDIACEQGDRSTAESLFADLSAYNSPEQNEHDTMRLQALALDQLGVLGITEEDLEGMAHFISQEVENPDNLQLREMLKSTLEQLGLIADGQEATQAIQKRPSLELIPSSEQINPTQDAQPKELLDLGKIGRELRERYQRDKENEQQGRIDYEMLAGFDSELAIMRSYGFLSAADSDYREFIAQSAAMHGVSLLALDEAFLFHGPSREDTGLFALATAGEIGFPLLRFSVDLDDQGNGTIKLTGPFRRGFIGGPPEMMELATPCILLIENIDFLEQMFASEREAFRYQAGEHKGSRGVPMRSMQAEVTGYLRALSSKSDIFVIATSEHAGVLPESLGTILGPLQAIEIASPREDERRDVLVSFAAEHPSFAELDINEIARFSEGLSRHELVAAVHAAVELAYRESLKTGKYHKVSIGEVLIQIALFIDRETPLYQQVEDEAVAEFCRELDVDITENTL